LLRQLVGVARRPPRAIGQSEHAALPAPTVDSCNLSTSQKTVQDLFSQQGAARTRRAKTISASCTSRPGMLRGPALGWRKRNQRASRRGQRGHRARVVPDHPASDHRPSREVSGSAVATRDPPIGIFFNKTESDLTGSVCGGPAAYSRLSIAISTSEREYFSKTTRRYPRKPTGATSAADCGLRDSRSRSCVTSNVMTTKRDSTRDEGRPACSRKASSMPRVFWKIFEECPRSGAPHYSWRSRGSWSDTPT
jgi:hypothetical protein